MATFEIQTRLMENRFCMLYEQKPEFRVNNIVLLFKLLGDVLPDIFSDALSQVLQSHDLLRARFEFRGARYVAVIREYSEYNLEVLRLDECGHEALLAAMNAASRKVMYEPIVDPPIRVILVIGLDGLGGVIMGIDHNIADGHATNLICSDLFSAYGRLRKGESARIPPYTPCLAECSAAEDRYMHSAEAHAALIWWRNKLQGAVPATCMSNANTTPAHTTGWIDATKFNRIKSIARATQVSPSTVILAKYCQILGARNPGRPVVTKSVYSLRTEPFDARLVSNRIDHRIHVLYTAPQESLVSLSKKTHMTIIENYKHYIPYWHLTNVLYPDLYLSNCGFIGTEFNFVSDHKQSDSAWCEDVTRIIPDGLHRRWETYQSGLVIFELGERLQVNFVFDTEFVDVQESQAMIAHMVDW